MIKTNGANAANNNKSSGDWSMIHQLNSGRTLIATIAVITLGVFHPVTAAPSDKSKAVITPMVNPETCEASIESSKDISFIIFDDADDGKVCGKSDTKIKATDEEAIANPYPFGPILEAETICVKAGTTRKTIEFPACELAPDCALGDTPSLVAERIVDAYYSSSDLDLLPDSGEWFPDELEYCSGNMRVTTVDGGWWGLSTHGTLSMLDLRSVPAHDYNACAVVLGCDIRVDP